MREGLKGNISHAATTVYYDYPTGIQNRDIQVFDRQGRFVKAMVYDTSKKIAYDLTFQYDKNNRLISYKQYIGKIMQVKHVNFYNLLGQVSMQYTYLYTHGYPNSHFKLWRYIYKYNKKRQLVEMYRDESGVDIWPTKELYTYNSKGQKILFSNPGHDRKYALLYNSHGDIKQRIDYLFESNDTTRYEYMGYDKIGNWRRKQEFRIIQGTKEPGDITIRKIAYFKK